ncbi:MAG: phytanoyl-CoA dioxygenase family protein [Planctomycetota bacterium]|nr:phytanoyl-CoA dioxygenase family protein [Planctomycetota bacterium]MDA1139442.1 phytanoyl-CoA dioxygenase family protein [Planctomycetota bacterium]
MSGERIDNRDWSLLPFEEQLFQLEVEGYLVIPDLLSAEHLEMLRAETESLKTRAVDYSVHQRVRQHLFRDGGEITKLIAHKPTTEFLGRVFGDDVVFMSYTYACSEPGHPGISLHTDGQPYGSKIFGYEGSVPVMIRVLYYLQDLTSEVSPFRVVPRSHLSMHADGNPYLRFKEHPEQVLVTAKAGSAVFLNHKTFHGNFSNVGNYAREMLAIGYRPAWGGPVREVDTWTEEDLKGLPAQVLPFFIDPNISKVNFDGDNKPAGMRSVAPGINPSRYRKGMDGGFR